MTATTYPKTAARPLPADAANVALIAADTSAAIGSMSTSWWLDEVRAGRAPRPVIQRVRCTRWRLADVLRFWADLAAQSATDSEAVERMAARGKKASDAARKPEAVAARQRAQAQG